MAIDVRGVRGAEETLTRRKIGQVRARGVGRTGRERPKFYRCCDPVVHNPADFGEGDAS
jgi:hypothetical protein